MRVFHSISMRIFILACVGVKAIELEKSTAQLVEDLNLEGKFR
jgi:hypothetical protein